MLELPGYEIDELIHDSSASALYRGRRMADGVAVIIKVPQTNTANARQLTRYRNEHDILRALSNDRVVKAHGLLRHKGLIALILEEFDGIPLKAWRMHQQPSLLTLLHLAASLTEVLGYVHSAGIVHKDINSHNILINPKTLELKLIDFGIATRLATEDGKYKSASALEGTLAYIAPEQTGRMNRSVDYRADWYSLGITLYELFSAKLPHDSDDPLECVHFHIAGKATPLAELDARIPRAVSAIVMKLLRKEPEDRYQSMKGILADLQTCIEQLHIAGRIEPFDLASADGIDRFELPEKLYGREQQTKALLDAFERVASGGVEAVLVAGAEGTGKTSLVQEIYRPATGRRVYVAAGKFDQLRKDVPFSAIVDALQGLVGQLLTESEESIEAWRAAILDAVGINGRVVTDVIPALELIIGRQPELRPLAGTEAQNRFNLCFQSFIQVLASRSHSLVLFLDDMQWADAASLNLVTVILSAPATKSLLFVFSYRNNETNATHPFILAATELEHRGVPIAAIELEALSVADVGKLVGDALRRHDAEVASLAKIIHRKTAGNPFFVRQFLQSLHSSRLIEFDESKREFAFDIATIKAAAITDNVAELLTSTLDQQPPATRHALQAASAIGRSFELDTLAIVIERTPADTFAALQPALAQRLVAPASGLEDLDPHALDSPLVYRHLEFTHDRIQQAAYGSLPPADRPRMHLKIGRVLQARNPEASEERLFDVVSHMNLGAELVTTSTERQRLAELNLRAGIKSRDSTAHAIAAQFFRQALALGGQEDDWRSQPEFVYDTHARLAEVCGLTAEYGTAFDLIDVALRHTEGPMQRVRLFALKVGTYLSMGDLPEALVCGREAARTFGIELPSDPVRAKMLLDTEIQSIFARAETIGVENLIDLPVMQDEDTIAFMTLLTHCLPAAYQTDQQLFALICCKMVSMSLDKGNCPLSARAYGSFAALLSGAMARHLESYAYAKLAVDLAHRFGDTSVYSGVHFLLALFASHWQEPIDTSIALLDQAVRYGLQTGDHVHGGYSAARRICHLQFRGMPLEELAAQSAAAHDLLVSIGDAGNLSFLEPRMRFIEWLRDETRERNDLGTRDRDEATCTADIVARGNKSFEGDWFMLLTKQRYLGGQYDQAWELGQRAKALLPFSAAFATSVEFRFYAALTASALLAEAGPQETAALESELHDNLAELRKAADECPANYGHMRLLAEAESLRHGGDKIAAMRLYDDAIDAAAAEGFTHIEALAAELAAKYWFSLGKPEFANFYVAKALSDYEVWGAARKVVALRETFGLTGRSEAANTDTSHSTTLGTSTSGGAALDLATALKASQALASEIVLEKLLAKMLAIVLESAGGERAVLALGGDGDMRVQAIQDNTENRTAVMLDEPLGTSTELARGIVNYVMRTSENVVLANPAARSKFRNDPYIRARQPKSVLSAPILHKGRLTGVIYIENNQVAGAFTSARLEALDILMSQIAVSIENATLYARLEQQADAIEMTNTALETEVHERRKAEEELSLYRDHLEDLVAQRTRELEKAQHRLLEFSRRAGMAEVASGVLHNVGNVMNSVNVGAHVVRDGVKRLRVDGLRQVSSNLEAHRGDLGSYLATDPVGQRIPEYLRKLAEALASDKSTIGQEIDRLLDHLEHMKKIIAAQQSYAKTKGVTEVCRLDEIIETALEISGIGLRNAGIEIVKDYAELDPALFDRHQILQILVNLIGNARHALQESASPSKVLTIRAAEDTAGFVLEVRDNGVGIAPENLPKVFTHGFTTKKSGHGFGLHNCANAAQEMDGSLAALSDGIGKGASFVLRLPPRSAEALQQESESHGGQTYV